MLQLQLLLSLLLSATTVSVQAAATATTTNTTASLFLVGTSLTGYIATAGPTSTTYVLDCDFGYCWAMTGEYARVTAAPGVQEFHQTDDESGSTVHETCSFDTAGGGATTGATCWDTTSSTVWDTMSGGGGGTSATSVGMATWWGTDTYVPSPPATRGQDNIFKWPGFDAVLITSSPSGTGSAAATATATAAATATGNKTNNAVPRAGAGRFGYGVAALAVLAMSA